MRKLFRVAASACLFVFLYLAAAWRFVARPLALASAALLALALLEPSLVFAQTAADTASTTTAVTLPVGAWLSDLAAFIAAIAAAVIAWLFRFLPSSVGQILKTMQAEQLLAKAIDYAGNAVAGAEKGKTLSVSVGNSVVATSVQYVVDHGPGWLVDWLGGIDAIEQKIIARLSLEPAAQVTPAASTTTSLTTAAAPAASTAPLSAAAVSAPASPAAAPAAA